ncbi:hypothetical protein GCM10028857_14730 [Salinarchaeum chitinilyticum]
MTDTADDPTGAAAEPLRARLRVEPHESASCAVLSAGERGEEIVQTSCGEADDGDCACRAAVTVDVGGEQSREFVSGAVGEYCVCPAFREVNCAAEIEGFSAGALIVDVTVPDRAALRDLVDAVREREATVHLEQVLPLEASDGRRELRVDAGAITAKQREAIAVAVDRGYYERPRATDLDAIADALGISRSAASERLNAAETTLIRALVDATDLEQVGEAELATRDDGTTGAPEEAV